MFGFLSTVARLIGRNFRAWAQWAEANPEAAALQLDAIASVLDHRSRAYRRQTGWRAKRDRRIAAALREHGDALREHRNDSRELASVCSVQPGAWS